MERRYTLRRGPWEAACEGSIRGSEDNEAVVPVELRVERTTGDALRVRFPFPAWARRTSEVGGQPGSVPFEGFGE
jgi:hypothetical protein